MALKDYTCSSEQVIEFSELNADNSEFVAGSQVTVIAGASEHATCSSKVKLNNIVDYTWEERFYTGQLLAVHVDGKYIAYGIKAMGKSQSLVRIVNLMTSSRALIRGLNGMMQDIAFSYMSSPITLACVDVKGMVFIYSIAESGSDILCELRFQIHPINIEESSVPHRVFWCPYIPDELSNDEYDDKMSQLLAVTRYNKIELWSVEVVTQDFGCGPVSGDEVTRGRILIDAHKDLIVDAAFSPDGTAIATASIDGDCKFYQVYMHTKGEPRCLHHWQPHDGKSVTSLFFLDDHKNASPEAQFWKFAITGADNNCELKLWSCESWECLQTIRIMSKDNEHFMLKACIDPSSGFVFLSDMFHKTLYILEVQKEEEGRMPRVKSVNEFRLPYPILSFNIVDAGITLLKPNGLDELCNGDGGDDNQGIMVRMYLVQPKSLQECHIVFKPPQASSHPSTHQPLLSNISPNQTSFDGGMPEVEEDSTNTTVFAPSQLNLMTPDDFHASNEVKICTESPVNCITPIVKENISPRYINPAVADPAVVQVGFTSGGSSPSREVEEILSSPAYFIEESGSIAQISQTIPQPPPLPVLATTAVSNSINESVVSSDKMKSLEVSVLGLHSEISSLVLLLKQQNADLQSLRREVQEKSVHQKQQCISALSDWWTNQRSQIVKTVVTPLEQVVNPEMLSKKIANKIGTTLCEKVTGVFSREIDRSLNLAMTESSKQLKDVLVAEMNQRMTQTDTCMAQTIEKCFMDKNFSDTLVENVINSCGPLVEHSYKETMMKVVIPMFERASSTMFKQMNDTFSKGIEEYVKEMELLSSKWNEKAGVEVTSIKTATDQLTLTAQQFNMTVEKATKKLEETFTEVQKGLQSGTVIGGAAINNGNIRSRTVTPAPFDPNVAKAHLFSLIKSSQFNSAFQQALSASDLELVRFVCEKVKPQQVFTPSGCLIQQPILLSLIQQLSADMSNYNETKHKYLEEAVMNLDPSSTSREYMPSVLGALQKQLQNYIELNPKGSLAKRANLLLMATRSLLS